MNIRMIELPETAVIGKAGLCTEGNNISVQLWQQASGSFHEVAGLGLKKEDGSYAGFWGAMSDESMNFLPWEEDYTRGLYLAGTEVSLDAEAPAGWTKWILPARKYLVIDVCPDTYSAVFRGALQQVIPEMNLRLCGAVCDYTEPSTGQSSLYFPVEEDPGRKQIN
jgi:predicted transcriptional regulator YdeE